MRCYSGMLGEEFIAEMRDAAIRNNARPVIIDQIDALRTQNEVDQELEKCSSELCDMEQDRDDWRDKATEGFRNVLATCEAALSLADKASSDEMARESLTSAFESLLKDMTKKLEA